MSVVTPIVNTHVHCPPNFSAFTTVGDLIESATAQGARAIGISNFFDQSVYAEFAAQGAQAGIVTLFGLEFITLIDDLAAAGTRINDPANPGRMYLCGKGISPFKQKSAAAARMADRIRSGNDDRSAAQVRQLADWFASHGVPTSLTAASIAGRVAERAGVRSEWVSLQERHIARAFQEVLFELDAAERATALERIYGAPSTVDIDSPVALQGEIRSRLLKVGTPGFAPESALSFEDAYGYVLQMDGIPTYPTLADGVSPVCPFEASPEALAAELVRRGIHAAELIPNRNTSAVVDRYVRAFIDAGLIVMGGTEHNTAERIPIDPQCADGPLSDLARSAFYRATCVVAGHQQQVAAGQPGYVDAEGTPVGDRAHVDHLADLGDRLINH